MARPVYNSVLENIRHRINAMPNGASLPTIRELTAELKASQGSVQAALRQLIHEGLIKAYVGRGTFVERSIAGGQAVSAINPPRTKSITILRGDYPSRRGEMTARAVHEKLTAQGHRVITVTYSDYTHAMELLENSPRMDGCVMQSLAHQLPVRLLALLRERSDAMVVSGLAMTSVDVDAVCPNTLKTYEDALWHLYNLGHRNIALATGEPTASQTVAINTFKTLHHCMHLPLTPEPVIVSSTKFFESATTGMRESLTRMIQEYHGTLPFSALIVVSYASAVGAMEALKSAGLRVPQNISILVDDSPDITGEYASEFTLIGSSISDAATAIQERLEWRWQNPDAPCETIALPTRLVVRQSCAHFE